MASSKIALITGGSRGMGASHSRCFAQAGYVVFIADIDEEGGEATAESIRSSGYDARFVKLDVSNSAEWARVVAAIEDEAGPVDVLVNNAGDVSPDVSLAADELTDERWAHAVAVAQNGTFFGIRACISSMREAGGGSIINVSSIYADSPPPGYFSYSAGKCAIEGMTRSAANSYGTENIRVNAIRPGPIMTPALNPDPDDEARNNVLGDLAKRLAIKRWGRPEEVSAVVLFLASEAASYVTGAIIPVDGGFSAS